MLLDPVIKRLRLNTKRASIKQTSYPFSDMIGYGGSDGGSGFVNLGYGARVERGFRRNPVVHRCVRMVSEACASIPLVVEEAGVPSNEHKLAQILSRPNPNQSGGELLETIYTYLLLHGNAYIEIVGSASPTNTGGNIEGLYSLRPERMRLIPSASGWAQAYEYTAGGKTSRFDQAKTPTPILHLRLLHPQDDHYGLSPMEAAAQAIAIHNAANSWNQSLFDNAARPSGALVYRSSDGNNHLTEEQFTRLKQELENNFQGAQNAGRPLLLEGGLDWSSISLSPQDMDFISAKHSAARDIALAFGVPPQLLGIPGDNTYGNYAEANRAFWRQTILPLATRITSKLAHQFCAEGETISLKLDSIPALSEERQRLWQRVDKASFLNEDEKRAAVGLAPLAAGEKKESAQ